MSGEISSPEKQDSSAESRPTRIGARKLAILLVVAVGCAVIGIRWFIKSSTHIETDNAFVETRIVSISPRVSGTVKRVLVSDNQHVKQGDLLVELDEQDYRVRVSSAEAGVGIAENETSSDYRKTEGARAAVQSAKARQEQAMLDQKRGEALFSREVISKEQLDRLRTAGTVATAQLKEAEEALKRAMAEAGLAEKSGGRAKLMQRRAQLQEANLLLSYTRIYAPCDGYITRKSVEEGSNVQTGQPLMALVPLQGAWITANYKEAQLAHIKPGQKVEFSVDSYPGKRFSGRVDSIMAGTGAAFSLLPPENATGNYVKVVQRIPVKITIDSDTDPGHILRVGMSVIPAVIVERSLSDIFGVLNPFR